MTDWKTIYEDAKHWIYEAGERIRESLQQELTVDTKSNRNDLVTNVDRETEQYFIERIKEKYPSHVILGEEGFGDEVKSTDGIIWIIDPIDGTVNFVHQQTFFCISIAVYEDGVGKVGLVYDVMHDELFEARKGEGAYVDGKRLNVLRPVNLEDSILSINATWLTPNKRIDHERLVPLVKVARGFRSYGSAALELAYVACGRLDAYMTMRLSSWDFAAGWVLLEEVGGVLTTVEGEPVQLLGQTSVFAAERTTHEAIQRDYILPTK
ncbi:inositol monophosphatase family protein [Bacillus fonticola]|uniref:inositol monophosphatase family protein n=1 Tax=Bacillus fonticola TaxID=2728853 RepID=UPI0014766BA6|nr:inositol monophosphatase family protein [Bacillus fonticola]